MADHVDLYDQDFLAWTQEQAARLRQAAASRVNAPIDWEHVAEEIEDLGKAQRHELKSRLRTIVEHLLKLQHSPSQAPRPDWIGTVLRSRLEVQDIFDDSPSLKPHVPALLRKAQQDAVNLVRQSLVDHGEAGPSEAAAIGAVPMTEEQVLGDWLPPAPVSAPTPSRHRRTKH
ncbi:MAG TPA: DUF29 domain-containing protein [Acidisphaera sp.]|nr:DUF29 domain-containing protein [Acidisphaera sp.]